MRSLRSPVCVVLAMMVLGGCTKMIEVRVPGLDESGKPVFDYDLHDTAFVKPGDRIVWVCQCPPGTEFTVADLHYVGDVDEIVEMLLPYASKDPKLLEGRIQVLESVQQRLSVAEQPAADASGAVSEGPAPVQDAVAAALTLLQDFRSTLSPEEQRDLFKRDWVPPGEEFVDGTKRLRSQKRVAQGIGKGVWKFTWRVRQKGRSDAVTEWDPHIIGHEEKRF